MGQYGSIIGGVVGAVVGSVVPGLGTSMGWMIGSALGGAYSQSQQVIPGPKIGEIQQQTQQEGGFRPIVFGRSEPLWGNVIADSEPKIVTRRESQGKGGPKVESESAYRTYAVGFCEGQTELLQVWRNGILVYDIEDPSMAAENAKFLEYATWYNGAFDQPASPDLEEVYGAGQAPYFRGTSYLSFHNEDVTDQRGAWSRWQVRVFRQAVWVPPFPPGLPPVQWDDATQTGGSASVIANGTAFRGGSNTASFIRAEVTVSEGDWYWETTTGWILNASSGINHYGQAGIIRSSDSAYGLSLDRVGLTFDGGAVSPGDALFSPTSLYPDWVPTVPSVASTAVVRHWLTFAGSTATYRVAINGGAFATVMSGPGVFTPYACSRGTSQDSGMQAKDVWLYTTPEQFIYGPPSGAMPLALGSVITTDWVLPLVVKEIAERANLDVNKLGLDKMDWLQVVRGFTIGNAYSAAGSLQALSSVFFFDPCSAEGRVNFVPRGRDVENTILEGDMLDTGEPVEDGDTRRSDPIGVPRVLHLNYFDVAGGLNTDKQRSERPEGTRAEGEQSLQTTVILSADEAASVVARMHGLMVEQQKGELNFALPDNWLRLTESDPVFVQVGGKMVRAIISKVSTDDGEQRYKAVRDRQSLYTTQVQGIPAAPVTRPPSSVAGPTLVEFLDIPIQRDSHDLLGFYLAVSGILPAWPGAFVELSLDGGANYLEGQTTRIGSVVGELVTTLGDHPAAFPDTVNTCQVEIRTPNALLVATDLPGMMNRRNRAVIGSELVAFADPDEVSPGTWEIGHWLRGRKGSTTAAHAIGERFVLLDTAMFIPAELSWLGRDLTFRATTLGRPLDEATVVTVTFTGQSQVERRPAYLSARRDGTDAVVSWQGVGRLGGGVHVAMGAYFAGFRVTLTDGTTTVTVDTTSRSLTADLSAFGGPVTVRVQQRNSMTGLGPHIEVTI